MTEKPLQERERDIPKIIAEEVPQEGTVPQEGVQGQSFANGRTLPSIGSKSAVHQLKATHSSDNTKRNAVHRQLSVALDKVTKDSQTTIYTPSPSVEQRETALPEIDGKGSDAQVLLDIPFTPASKISKGFRSPISDDKTAIPQTAMFTPIANKGLLSPLTEDNWPASPENIETSLPEEPPTPSCTEQQQTGLCSTASTEVQPVDREKSPSTHDSPAKLSLSLPKKTLTLADIIAKVVHLLYEISRRWEVPKEIHSRILTTIQPSLGETPATAAVVKGTADATRGLPTEEEVK